MPASRAAIGDVKCTTLAAKPNLAGVGNDRAAEGLDQRRLAGAVVADDREDLARIKVEVGVVERGDPAVALDEAASLRTGSTLISTPSGSIGRERPRR